MIDLDYIKSFYSGKEKIFEQFILKEYLQYTILDIIFSSKYASHLSFLWWTAIRLIHHSTRFSEDLDFDNFSLSEEDFEWLSQVVKGELQKLWYEVEIKNVYKWAYRCYIRLPKILRELGFSALDDEKILIQIDTVKQDYRYKSDKKIIDKFDVYKMINVCPLSILLSKKIHALIDRKRTKWRDIFDIVFLYKFTSPDFDYLGAKTGIKDATNLRKTLLDFCKTISLSEMADDVSPFLINPDEVQRVLWFKEFIETI